MTSANPGLAAVFRQLRVRGGGGVEWYKGTYVARRIEMRMRIRGVETLAGYASLLARDPGEADRLLASLSVRVTGFFRDPESWRRLDQALDQEGPRLGAPFLAWSMGCSTGEEAWSLALLLDARARAGRPPASGFLVIGSDLDGRALARAEAARYAAPAAEAVRDWLGEIPGERADGQFTVDRALRDRVRFRREDLTGIRAEPARFDLVCCRNVLIFLSREGQERMLDNALRSLRPGGLLMLGRTETPAALGERSLVPLDLTHRIYRKPT
jgi:two-component system CheB/CheR fusion protein